MKIYSISYSSTTRSNISYSNSKCLTACCPTKLIGDLDNYYINSICHGNKDMFYYFTSIINSRRGEKEMSSRQIYECYRTT
jgi:hypothetical protein